MAKLEPEYYDAKCPRCNHITMAKKAFFEPFLNNLVLLIHCEECHWKISFDNPWFSEKRLEREQYFIEIAKLTAKRSTCRVQVGAIAVKDKRIIMSGYNGGLPGEDHCIDKGCIIRDGHCIRTIHAEQNLITQCAKHGISLQGATIFCTHYPCDKCYRILAAVGVKEIIYEQDYKNEESYRLNSIKCYSIQTLYPDSIAKIGDLI